MSIQVRIGTRKSQLARTQTGLIEQHLKAKGFATETVLIESTGDLNRTDPLHEVAPQTPGLFTKQIQHALSERTIDIAVHSMKDLPTTPFQDLAVISIPKRESSCDCLIANQDFLQDSGPLGLHAGVQIGTSSLRREAELKAHNPDFQITGLRGNVPTRINAVREGKIGATLLAKAGLNRLKLDLSGLHTIDLAEAQFVPAPAQGALAIEAHSGVDKQILEALREIHCETTQTEVEAERKIMKDLEGGCSLPLGVRCQISAKQLKTTSFLGIRSAKGEWLTFEHFEIEADLEESINVTIDHFRKIRETYKNEAE